MALKTTLTQPTASGTGTVIATPGMPGAANPVRIVGRNASGAPTTGTFQIGDVVVNTDGTEYVCSVAGTPGTWVALNPGYGTPVNIDASITSLSAGSLTTVARADHIHTLSKVPVLLASTTLSTTTQYVTFSSIPQTYTDLLLIYGVRLATASTYAGYQCAITVNGDTGANYTYYGLVNGLYVGQAHGATNYVTCPSANEVRFFNYSTTDQHKQVTATSAGWNNSTTAYNAANWSGNCTWLSNSAITSIRIAGSTAGDNMAAKSYFRLYGIL